MIEVHGLSVIIGAVLGALLATLGFLIYDRNREVPEPEDDEGVI